MCLKTYVSELFQVTQDKSKSYLNKYSKSSLKFFREGPSQTPSLKVQVSSNLGQVQVKSQVLLV